MSTLENILDGMTVEGQLYETLPDGAVRCYACGHRCLIRQDKRGICKVRFNRDGKLYVPWGYVASLQADPIEKKPFFHFLPGTDVLTFGMLGCDFHCGYCQNWFTSQALRDPASDASANFIRSVTADQMVKIAQQSSAGLMASSYNEPLITSEWSLEIFKLAQKAGLKCIYISNGNATTEALNYLRPYVDGYKIDLKTMQDKQYRKLGGVLNHVLDSVKLAYELGFWVEVVTMIVPGFNDSTDELMDAALFIASISQYIPWHVTAFHPDYQMTDPDRTSVQTITNAAEIGMEAGLKYVYAGNLPGKVDPFENTVCHHCQTLLIERYGYVVLNYKITEKGTCPNCETPIPGVWSREPAIVRIHGPGMPQLIV